MEIVNYLFKTIDHRKKKRFYVHLIVGKKCKDRRSASVNVKLLTFSCEELKMSNHGMCCCFFRAEN